MTLPNLLSQFTRDEILERLFELYPEQKKSREGYVKVINRLRHLQPETADFEIYIKRVRDSGQNYVDISGYKDNEAQLYAIEYCPWNEWLGAQIHPTGFKHFSFLDIICHCLWEMTWAGFEEKEIQSRIKSLEEAVKDIENTDG